MTVKLLVGSAIQREINKLMEPGGEASIAVAYWGDGGAKKTGVLARTRADTRIICDLFSGCCNPKEIRKLIDHAEVKTLDGLHAKVWCTSDKVVIGSANASANGLGEEGTETTGSIEACTLVENRKFAQDVQEWFEKTWNGGDCRQVDGKLINEAKSIWSARRSRRHRQSSTTLTEALKQRNVLARFQHVRVLAYERVELTKKQQRAADVALKRQYSPMQAKASDYPFYFDETGWKVSPGEIYLDFEVERMGGNFKFYGIYQVREDPRLTVEEQKLILCDPLLDLAGVRLSQAEQRALCVDIRKWINENQWQEDKDGNYMDLPLTDFLPSGWPDEKPGAKSGRKARSAPESPT